MGSRERGPDRAEAPRETDENGYPLLFRGEARSSRRGLLAWILDFFREPADEPDPSVQDAAPGHAPGPTASTSPDDVDALPEESPPVGEVDAPREGAETRTTEMDASREDAVTRTTEADASQAAAATRPTEGPAGGDDVGTPPVDVTAARQDEGTRWDPDEPPRGDDPTAPLPLHRATLQMLPGRLVPIDRGRLRQEIRFLRPAEPEQAITLGWAEEDPPDHVTIDHPSVESHHASMRYRRGHWWIRSLSAKHPVLLNGRPVHPDGGPRHLKDGDRVRLGDIDLRFHLP